jgi:hypothetical protein
LDVHAPHHRVEGWKDFFIHLLTISVGLLIAVGIEGCVAKVTAQTDQAFLEGKEGPHEAHMQLGGGK